MEERKFAFTVLHFPASIISLVTAMIRKEIVKIVFLYFEIQNQMNLLWVCVKKKQQL